MIVRFANLRATGQGDLETVVLETVAQMSEPEAMRVAELVCDFSYDFVISETPLIRRSADIARGERDLYCSRGRA